MDGLFKLRWVRRLDDACVGRPGPHVLLVRAVGSVQHDREPSISPDHADHGFETVKARHGNVQKHEIRSDPVQQGKGFSAVGRGRMLGTSSLFVLFVALVLVLVVMFRFTIFGRNVLATGGNISAARLSGIKVDRVVILCNVVSCALAAIAAMLWTSNTRTASPTMGSDWMLFSFAVCAIGGISLAGGNFTAIGFFCGACILTMVRNGLTMMHVDIYFEEMFIGAVILIAVSIESLRSRVARNLTV